ncbi:deoxyribonuclease TATDN1-like [Zophobas morio]|uniref:deoxyribonuclease TATDN1-like n=1 Tax=Zophobas morio TaxID=2755281 RepID=UPI003082BF7B
MKYKFIDIGANLTDAMFKGIYHGKTCHPGDLSSVLKRSFNSGLEKLIITGGDLKESEKALSLCYLDERLYCTVGCHPTRCLEFETFPSSHSSESYYHNLLALAKLGIQQGKVVACGECGLDYSDRLRFCPKQVQMKYFEKQVELAGELSLPLFLHCRNSFNDFFEILNRNRDLIIGGVVHSFDGSLEEALRFVESGFFIGINGCSLKTVANLEVARAIPAEHLLLETDSPWCEIRPSHSSYALVKTRTSNTEKRDKRRWSEDCQVKSRNEPCNIVQVLEVIADLKNVDPVELSETIYENTETLFFRKKKQ